MTPDLHLSLVNLSLVPLADSEEEGLLALELLSLASEPESEPQAVRARPRTAVPASILVHVAVVDRFTG